MKKEHSKELAAIVREFEASVKADQKRDQRLEKLALATCPFKMGDTVEWFGGYPRKLQRGIVQRICAGSPGYKEVGNKPYPWAISIKRYLQGHKSRFAQERVRIKAGAEAANRNLKLVKQ